MIIYVASQPVEHQGNVTGEQQESDGDDDGNNTNNNYNKGLDVYIFTQCILQKLCTCVYIGVAHTESRKKKKINKKSIYPVISKSQRPCAIIINNQTYASKPGLNLSERSWSKSDMDKIYALEKEFGFPFIVHNDLKAQEMKDKLASAVDSQSTYSGLLLFIMTHGADGDMLYGSDGELIALDELVAFFEADKCPSLKGKPKIFILHCCRGEGEEPAHREGRGRGSKKSTKYGMHVFTQIKW